MVRIKFCLFCIKPKRKQKKKKNKIILKNQAKINNLQQGQKAKKNLPKKSEILPARRRSGRSISLSKSFGNCENMYKDQIEAKEENPRKISMTEVSTELFGYSSSNSSLPFPSFENFPEQNLDEEFSIRVKPSTRERDHPKESHFIYDREDDISFVFSGCKVMNTQQIEQEESSVDVFHEENKHEMDSLCRRREYH